MTKEFRHPYLESLQAQYRNKQISRRQFIKSSVLLGLSIPAALSLTGCEENNTNPGEQQPNLLQGKVGGYVSFSMNIPPLVEPQQTNTVHGANLLRLISDSLIRIDNKNLPVPWLLQRWEVSDDLLSWTFYLRPNIYWSNGDELTVDHVIWNLQRWLDPRLKSSLLPLMKSYMLEQAVDNDITGSNPENQVRIWSKNAIQRINSHVFRLNTKIPQIAIPEHLAYYGAYILHPADGGEFKKGMLGTGTYELTDFVPGRLLTLKRKEKHWLKTAFIETIDVLNYTSDPVQSLQKLVEREIDGMQDLNLNQHAAVLNLPFLKVYRAQSAQTGLVRMLMTHPLCQDWRVRKAMRLALDNQKLLQVGYNGLGVVAEHHHISPTHPDYYLNTLFKQNIEEAKSLMQEAGHSRGFNTEIICRQNPEWEFLTTQAISNMLREINIQADVRVFPGNIFNQAIESGDFPFAFTSWPHRPLGIMTISTAYRSNVAGNITLYSNKLLDEKLDQAGAILDPIQRSKVMRDIQIIMQDNGPICQPFWQSIFAVMNKRVQNFELHPAGYIFPENWWISE